MNDIKILEELRHELGLYANGEKVRQGQAIENLIQRNKELEMQNKEFLLRLKADGLIERDKYWTNKIKKALYDGILEAKGWGCEDGAYLVQKEFENLIKEIN